MDRTGLCLPGRRKGTQGRGNNACKGSEPGCLRKRQSLLELRVRAGELKLQAMERGRECKALRTGSGGMRSFHRREDGI